MASWCLERCRQACYTDSLTSPRDMRQMAASGEAAGSGLSSLLVKGLCSPIGCCGSLCSAITTQYAGPTLVGTSCRLPSSACLLVQPWAADPSSNICRGAEQLCTMNQTIQAEELVSFSFACKELRILTGGVASLLVPHWRSKAERLEMLALVAARVFLLPTTIAFPSSQRKTGKSSRVDKALIKASSSSLSIVSTAQAHCPITLLPPMRRWLRGGTSTNSSSPSLFCSVRHSFNWA